MSRDYTVIIERDEEGYLIASVPALPGCHTQARSMDELIERIKEAIELCRVVPVPGHETLGPGRLRKIARDVELSREEFIAILAD